MILDSSPVISVLLRESGHQGLEGKMRAADVLAIGAPTLLETEMVLISAQGEPGRLAVSRFRASLSRDAAFARVHMHSGDARYS